MIKVKKLIIHYYYFTDHKKYDLHKLIIHKKIRTKKFICVVPIGSGKSIAIHKWIFLHKIDKFMVIVPMLISLKSFLLGYML